MNDELRDAIFQALTKIAIEIAATVVVLLFEQVVQWFLTLQELIDENAIAFTLRTELDKGVYTVFQGVFDTRTDTVMKARRISAKRFDQRLREAHQRSNLAIYT